MRSAGREVDKAEQPVFKNVLKYGLAITFLHCDKAALLPY